MDPIIHKENNPFLILLETINDVSVGRGENYMTNDCPHFYYAFFFSLFLSLTLEDMTLNIYSLLSFLEWLFPFHFYSILCFLSYFSISNFREYGYPNFYYMLSFLCFSLTLKDMAVSIFILCFLFSNGYFNFYFLLSFLKWLSQYILFAFFSISISITLENSFVHFSISLCTFAVQLCRI